ncbi:hypothetical protein TNCV_4062461 [Trichonephila clavipes]|nr:hypothetical protein TNCV_4062461 [Trichonephila clavipes]
MQLLHTWTFLPLVHVICDRNSQRKISHILRQVTVPYLRGVGDIFRQGENVSQAAEIANGVYGPDTVTANYVQFLFHRFHSGVFDVKGVPRTGRTVVENHRNSRN